MEEDNNTSRSIPDTDLYQVKSLIRERNREPQPVSLQQLGVHGVCENIMTLFATVSQKNLPIGLEKYTGETVSLGKHHDIATRRLCPVCNLVLKLIPIDHHQRRYMSSHRLSPLLASQTIHEYFVTVIPRWGDVWKFGPLPRCSYVERINAHEHSVEVHDNEGLYLGNIRLHPGDNSDRVSLPSNDLLGSTFARWISTCASAHMDSEATDLRPDLPRPVPIDITLVDVVDRCLVRSSSNVRYLALSYVWGRVSGLQLRVSNRADLEVPGSLASVQSNIPRTIQDAIHLASRMGERYLWVDSLCIEQDNALQKHFNISQMNVIYSQAVATLVVLSGKDARSPIPGVNNSRSRPLHYLCTAPWPCIMAETPGFERSFAQSTYEKRAWTLQERFLSTRCLFFTDRATYFYCRHGSFFCDADRCLPGYSRSVSHGSLQIQSLLNPLRLESKQSGPQHVLQAYTILAQQYSARQLSFDTDSLNAFSGMLALLQTMSGGGSVGGLLETVLDFCLLWVPVIDADSPQQTKARNYNFCSWSWAGWAGAKSYFNGPLYLGDFEKRKYSFVNRTPQLELSRRIEDIGASFETAIRPIKSFPATSVPKEQEMKPSLGRDVLHFTAEVAQVLHFKLLEGSTKGARGTIELGESVIPCGLYYHLDVSPSSQQLSPSLSFIALSEASCPRHKKSFGEAGSELSPERHMHQSYCTKPACFIVHAMIVQWHGERAERVGLASIQLQAWEMVERVKRRVTLV